MEQGWRDGRGHKEVQSGRGRCAQQVGAPQPMGSASETAGHQTWMGGWGHRRGKVGKTCEGEGMSSGQAKTGGHGLGWMFPGSFTEEVSRWQPSHRVRPVGQLLKGGPCHPYSCPLQNRGQGAARSTGAGHRCMVRAHRAACSASMWRAQQAAWSAGSAGCLVSRR